MFQTIKSKIIALTLSTLFILFLLMIGVSAFNYKSNERLIVDGNKYHIEHYTEQINSEISKLEDNVRDLALLTEFYVQSGKSPLMLQQMVAQDFMNYPHTLGGGVWFKPYILDSNQRLFSVYAYRNENNQVVLDDSFSSDAYDYPMQRWYLDILPHLNRQRKVVWTSPYFENQGSDSLMTTLGTGIYSQGQLIGIATVDWKMQSILNTISKMKPTAHSFVLFADKKNDFVISTTDDNFNQKKSLGLSLKVIPWYHENLEQQKTLVYQGRTYIPFVKNLANGMILIINIPEDELFGSTLTYVKFLLSLLFIFSLLISLGIYFILQKYINRPMAKLTTMANKIGQGNLDMKVDIQKPFEFSCLAKTLNQMTQDLKKNLRHLSEMTKTKEKIEAELSVAHQIQSDALPQQFPLHPAFEICASMKTAKDVGGDFYDFFFVDKTHFAFVMADVSGKGITAALFMMSAKTMIRNILQSGHPLKQAIQKVNRGLCDNNSRGMFVTAFVGILDLQTGIVQYVNAGHCPVLLKNKQGYDFTHPVANLVLGVVSDFDFQISELKLHSDDRIFLYTDGVTEAQNKKQKLYGNERLKKTLNQNEGSLQYTIENVQKNIQEFVQNAEQSDDITMMEILYHGLSEKTGTFLAEVNEWPQVAEFLRQQTNVSEKTLTKLELIAEEIFTNIAKYAYQESGSMRLLVKEKAHQVILTFSDWGVPYNPLKQSEPNIRAKVSDRKIGGLGLYMVKQMSEKQTYVRQGGQNILTIQIQKEEQ